MIAVFFVAIAYFATEEPRQPTIQEEVKASPPLSWIQQCLTLAGTKPNLPADDPRAIEQDARYKQCLAAYQP